MKPLWIAAALPLIFPLVTVAPPRPAPIVPEPDRSPADVALSSDGRLAVTANRTADTASLVDLRSGRVVTEAPVGHRPFCVALAPNGTRAVVTNSWSNTITLLAVAPDDLKAVRSVPVGDEPRGVTFSRDGSRAFVALAGEASVAVLDMNTLRIVKRLPVGAEPWQVAITPDGSRLVVGNARGRTVSVLDAKTGTMLHTVKVLGRNLRHIAVSPDGTWAYLPAISERGLGTNPWNIERGWVIGNRLTRIPLKESGPREAVTLDTAGRAVADVDGATISPDGRTIALTAAGTHELLLLRLTDLPFVAYGGPGDHMEPAVRDDPARFRRIPLGGRPLGARFTADGRTVIVANYLLNAVQAVDVASGTITKTIPLGGPSQPSLARKGESLFTDATRCLGHWYSCNSCHTEGHTNGGSYDTLSDGGFGKPKKTLSLRGVGETAPYTWHGWNPDLRRAIHDSLVKTMQGSEPTEEDITAIEAYLKTLAWRPSPYRAPDGSLTPAAKRGEVVFAAKGCTTCHGGPNFTRPIIATAGLEEPDDMYKGYNPPPLRGVYDRSPYLHDGRASTLEQVLTEHHRPSKLTGKPDLTPADLSDLVAYLKSL